MQSPLSVLRGVRKARLAEKKGTAYCEHLPFRLVVETSSVCNLRCPMCPASQPAKFARRLMKFSTFKRVIDEAASFVNEIDLSHRGEPLLNERLPAMIAYADDKRVSTHFSTNATRLTEELALRLIQSGLSSVTFSVDGLDSDAYERVRVGARYGEVMSNVINFLKMKRRLRSRTPATSVEVLDLPEAPVDEEKATRFLKNFRSLPPVRLVIASPHTWGGAVELNPGRERVPSSRISYGGCPNIWNTMVILADGCVALCPQDWYNDNPVGNIHASTLKEMWNGWTLTFVRQLLADRQHHQIELCSQCQLLSRARSRRPSAAKGGAWVADRIVRFGRSRSYLVDMRGFVRRF